MKTVILFLALIIAASGKGQTTEKFAGIPNDKFFAHAQENTNWCWAASVQMILQYNTVYKTQSEIVERTFGRKYSGELPNIGGSVQNISDNLNNWDVDILNRPSEITSSFVNHRPNSEEIYSYLSNKQPLLLSYRSGLNTNHAIVITGCKYIETSSGKKVTQIIVRDPWPSAENVRSDGLITYDYDRFYSLMNYFWIVSFRLKGSVSVNYSDLADCKTEFCNVLKQALAGFNNDFSDIKGDAKSDLNLRFNSKLKFPSEVSSVIWLGEGNYIHYDVSFYRGLDAEESKSIFEKLKNYFSFFNISFETGTMIPLDDDPLKAQNSFINLFIDIDKVVTLRWRYSKAVKKYTVDMVMCNKKDFL